MINGYELAYEVFENIGENENHEISIEDMIRVLSFWGFNEEAAHNSRIGFVCYCARNKMKKIFEKALIWDDFKMYEDLIKAIENHKSKKS